MQVENTPGLATIAVAAFSQQAGVARQRPGSSSNTEQQTPLDRISSSSSDSVEISEEAQNRSPSATPGETQLSEEEKKQLQELKQRDREVRAHEQAHRARGGQYIRGGTKFEFQRGPDGQLYAVGGEVQIDTSKVPDDPEATIRKMRTVRAAALAPGEPSATDRRVAAEATRKEAQARAELQNQSAEEIGSENSAGTAGVREASGQDQTTEQTASNPAARGSILPFLNNQRIAATPGELLNVFA